MPDSEPKKYTDAWLYEQAGEILAISAKPGGAAVDPSVVLAIVRRYRELIDAERKRKGRPAGRPRRGGLGEMVEDRKPQFGGNVTKARQAVAKETGKTMGAVGEAHRRWLRKPVVVHRPSN